MSIYNQLKRIKQKLPLAQTADQHLEVFGAKSHQYQLNQSLTKKEIEQFELTNHVTLPETFRLFLMEVGNGGAGPYYGIYPLHPTQKEAYLSKPCQLHPALTDEEWSQLINLDDDADDAYETNIQTVFQGMLTIGSRGCDYDMMLIVSGQNKGRVVYTEWDYYKPFFTYENHFLDWYERWLDEIIKGYQISCFGMNMDGDEQTLIHQFHTNDHDEFRTQAIMSMHKFPTLSADTISFLVEQCHNGSKALKRASLQVLTKHSYHQAKPFLQKWIESKSTYDQLNSLQYIHWYARGHKQDWIKEVENLLTTNHHPDIERFASYILK